MACAAGAVPAPGRGDALVMEIRPKLHPKVDCIEPKTIWVRLKKSITGNISYVWTWGQKTWTKINNK